MAVLRMSICFILLVVLMLIKQIHIIQLNSYNFDQQIIWYKKNFTSFIFNIVMLISSIITFELNFYPFHMLTIICMVGILIDNLPRKQKRKLVFTFRIKRLIFVSVGLLMMFFLPIFIIRNEVSLKFGYYGVALMPLIIFLAFCITLPIENGFRKKFMKKAHDNISHIEKLYKIGITGSFGKTSTKYYLYEILKNYYNVCITKESYNTSMGATLTIMNDLKSYDDIFICEMGARRIGDIKEICEIVKPDSCIITDVGDMHLDTFKNIENVLKTKFELVDSVYNNDICKNKIILVYGDNKLIKNKISEYKAKENVKFYTFGSDKDNDFFFDNVKVDSDGTLFDFHIKGNRDAFTFNTKLLGFYNIKNLVSTIAFSYLYNVDLDEIKSTISNIRAVNHRLSLINYDSNNLIIDDAYNSNLYGAENAVNSLSMFGGYTKIIITPGMVELGEKQNAINEEFAKYACDKVDYAIVVGNTNKDALKKGFSNKLSNDNLICIDKVDIAINYAKNNISGKKVILLENDLSDNY